MYFIRTSNASVPPGAPYIRLSIGDMSDARMDCRISMTVARWASWSSGACQLGSALCNVADLVVGSPSPERWKPWLPVQRDLGRSCLLSYSRVMLGRNVPFPCRLRHMVGSPALLEGLPHCHHHGAVAVIAGHCFGHRPSTQAARRARGSLGRSWRGCRDPRRQC